jgi:catalase
VPNNAQDPTSAPAKLSAAATVLRLGLIGVVVLVSAGAFAYVGGWLSPDRLTQERMIAGFEAVNGPHPGFRRNHAKGICATGWFDSSGKAASLSKAAVFAPGRVPVVGRIAFAGGMPFIPDETATVRSLALRFLPAGAEEWRTGMIDLPVFPVASAQAFYDQMLASKPDPTTGKPDPAKMQAFAAAHPEFVAAIGIIKDRPVASGFANTKYNALHVFRLVNAAGEVTPVRWSTVPVDAFAAAGPAPASAGKNYMFDALIAEVAEHPVRWRLMITVGQPSDPTNPTLPWPADRQQVEAGVVTIDKLSSEDDGGPCIDVNYDPTVLPPGIELSDDPILSARSSAYSRSFTLREGEKGEKPPSAVTPQEVRGGGKS